MKQARSVVAILMLVIAALGFWYALQSGVLGPKSGKDNQVTKIQLGGPFELTDHWGDKVTDVDFHGKNTLIFFGYTFCPDVCPTALTTISTALDILGDASSDINALFVTVDPERDTPAYLKEYLEHFHPAFIGLTGDSSQIKKIAKAYGVYYARAQEEDSDPDDYLMDHTSLVFLMDPAGQYKTHFSHTVTSEQMAEKILDSM